MPVGTATGTDDAVGGAESLDSRSRELFEDVLEFIGRLSWEFDKLSSNCSKRLWIKKKK